MLFNSYGFIFAFLPVTFLVYFILCRFRWFTGSTVWLVLCSLFFYGWWNVIYVPLILFSMIVNYRMGALLVKENPITHRKKILTVGIVFNLLLLGFFKYSDFFIANVNTLFSADVPFLHLVLPLAISFFTFQQIAYLVDAYRNETKEVEILNYCLFVTFFPQLIAGPIVHHKEMMPQFASLRKKSIRYKNISLGIFIFTIGLFKKVMVADTFAVWATEGFDHTAVLTCFEAWLASLSYTFQLYFDFSGYTDMAIGAALLFNIRLPINFNSPYKALNIQDFWRRWHITLTRFMFSYVYIPLGGNRLGKARTYINVLLVFAVSGLWHGAGWTFIFWGLLHGVAAVIHRLWQKLHIRMNKFLAWFLTFNFVNIAWIFFRAQEWDDAIKVLKGMFFMNEFPAYGTEVIGAKAFFAVLICLFAVVYAHNSMQLLDNFRPSKKMALFWAALITILVFSLNQMSEFLYFNF